MRQTIEIEKPTLKRCKNTLLPEIGGKKMGIGITKDKIVVDVLN